MAGTRTSFKASFGIERAKEACRTVGDEEGRRWMALVPKGQVRRGGHGLLEVRLSIDWEIALALPGDRATWCVLEEGVARERTAAGLWVEEARREDNSLEIMVIPSMRIQWFVRKAREECGGGGGDGDGGGIGL
ncbi:hypothetical protein LTR29_003147 [Friedmanniomyces endolithicus]|nr:hypothetical protein LTR29_003147 [Friedmanniomyces endolithicus]